VLEVDLGEADDLRSAVSPRISRLSETASILARERRIDRSARPCE
jgi:hypothetical protein